MFSPVLEFGEAGYAIHPAMIIGLVSVASASVSKVADYGMEQVLSVRHTVGYRQGYIIVSKVRLRELVIAVTVMVILPLVAPSARLYMAGLCLECLTVCRLSAPRTNALPLI